MADHLKLQIGSRSEETLGQQDDSRCPSAEQLQEFPARVGQLVGFPGTVAARALGLRSRLSSETNLFFRRRRTAACFGDVSGRMFCCFFFSVRFLILESVRINDEYNRFRFFLVWVLLRAEEMSGVNDFLVAFPLFQMRRKTQSEEHTSELSHVR